MSQKFKIIIRVVISFSLGAIFNKVFSFTNRLVGATDQYSYEVPFIYILTISDILAVLTITSIIGMFLYFYFNKSKSSQNDISKIYRLIIESEILLFSFVIGTSKWQKIISKDIFNINQLLNNRSLNEIILLFIFIAFSSIVLSTNEIKSKKPVKLYSSRISLLGTIDEYLKSMNSFSIIGEWGIGKTKLIENFFYGNYKDSDEKEFKNKYELLYIDASIYTNSQKIIEAIESDLNLIFKNYGILKKNTSFIDELFIENNTFLKTIYKYVFSNKTVNEEKYKIEKRIKDIKKNYEKDIVICLDNLERLNSKEKIIELFAIINEIFPSNVKKIYIYEEKEMIELFKDNSLKNLKFLLKNYINDYQEMDIVEKDSNQIFLKYIEKYTFNKIEVKNISMEEILKDKETAKEVIEEIIEKCNNSNKFIKLVENVISKNYTGKDEYIENLKKDFNIKLNEIKNRLRNPRYVDNFLNYLKGSQQKEEEYKYKIQYKITRDFLLSINRENIKIKDISSNMLFNAGDAFELSLFEKSRSIKNEKIGVEGLEKLCYIYLFKIDEYGQNVSDFAKKESYFEIFFENKKMIEQAEEFEKLEKFKKNPEKNLLDIINQIIFLYPEEFVKKIKDYLRTQETLKYIISVSDDLSKLIYLEKLVEYSEFLLPKIILNENGKYSDGGNKKELEEYHSILTKVYLLKNNFIKDLIQIMNKEELKDFYKLVPNNFNEFLKTKLNIETLEEFIEILLKKTDENKEILDKLKTYEITKKSIETLKNINNLKKDRFQVEEKVLKISDELLKTRKINILEAISDKGDYLEIHDSYSYEEIIIKKTEIDTYIEELEERGEKNQKLMEGIRTIIIELDKFKKKVSELNGKARI